MKKTKHVLKAIASGFVWGLGQLFNKQPIKALMFFIFFIVFVGAEFLSGSYLNIHDFNVYDNLNGNYFGSEKVREAFTYQFTVDYLASGEEIDDEFESKLREVSGLTGDIAGANSNELYAFTADHMVEILGTKIRSIYDAHTLYDEEGNVKYESDGNISLDVYQNARIEAEIYAQQNKVAYAKEKVDPNYTDKDSDAYKTALKAEVENQYNILYASRYRSEKNKLFSNLLLEDELISFAVEEFVVLKNNPSYQSITGDDWSEFVVRVYYSAFPEIYNDLVDGVNDFFYVNGGFFTKGIWGLFTLGTSPIKSIDVASTLSVLSPVDVPSVSLYVHNSVTLLLTGIVAVIILLFFIVFFIWTIKDAYKTSVQRAIETEKAKEDGRKPVYQTQVEYFEETYENCFEYIILIPTIVLMAFITIMPIVFSFLVAFTNYDHDHIPPGQLFSWVGLENFANLFSFTSGGGIPFGDAFWRVMCWTLIWAVGSTFTCFFGGFLQAIIVNNERVIFRKFWRTVLILPWAVPALVSQMMFKLFFDSTNGAMNTFLQEIGVTKFLTDNNFLRSAAEVFDGNFIDKLTYLGEYGIQWYNNPINPWLPRLFIIVLNIWLGFPYFMAMMSGIMTSISKDLYEAAEIDGATKLQQFQKITVPLVLYSTAPLLIMSFSSNFNNFGVIYFVTGGGYGTGSSQNAFAGNTDILISWIYSLTTNDTNQWYSMASVFSILIFIVVASISTYNFLQTKSFKEEDMM